jgi:putative flippase GtrA
MKLLTQRDVGFGLATGLTTGIIAWQILTFLRHALPGGIDPLVLVPVVPVAWLAGVQLGYVLGLVLRPMEQFGRFAAIGFANAAVDFGVLYFFIATTGHAGGLWYAGFKAVSFCVASVHSYLYNKFWTFSGAHSKSKGELARFITVALGSVVINTFAASLVVVLRPAGFDPASWAGVGAIVGSATALILSFVGFRVFVFRSS